MVIRIHDKIGQKIIFLLLPVFIFASACSSAPKKPAEIFTDRIMAAGQLDLANRTANQGRYEDALLIIEDARRLATGADDSPLLVKTSIARGNCLFSLGHHDEAFGDWEAARKEADSSGENDLSAMAQIYTARGRLILLINSGSKTGVEEIRDRVNVLTSSIKSDFLARAMGYLVLGMAEKELGNYTGAEKWVRQALEIHEKNRYLEDAAYDWYFIASIFSVSRRYDEALAALKSSIDFDRRAENGFGLASGWQAMGEVYLKKKQPDDSAAAFRRAADIFMAIGLEDAAKKAEAKASAAGSSVN